MRKFGELPKWVLLLEVLGIVMLILVMLSVNQWLTLPGKLQSKGASTLMIFAGIALMLPAAITLMWRTAQALAPELFGRPRAKKSSTHHGDTHDADH